MGRVDLQDPEQLVEARRALLEAVGESERISASSRIGLSQLLDDAARRVAAIASMDPVPTGLLAAAMRLEADIRGQGTELVATIVRASAEIRSRGTESAGFLAKYHAGLTGARTGYAARSSTSVAGYSVAGGAAGQSEQRRDSAIAAAREAVQSAMETDGQGTAELSEEEIAAIRRYTSEEYVRDWQGHWYEIGNALLRGDRKGSQRTRMTLADLERFERAGNATAGIAAAIRGLKKLPASPGVLHRGIETRGWTADEKAVFMKQFVPGTTYRDSGFFSASWREEVAKWHAGERGIILHVEAKEARSIENLAALGRFEHEAVLLPFTQFRVRRVRSDDSGLTQIWLNETGG